MKFTHRIRVEERFFHYGENSLFGVNLKDDFEVRARYQLLVKTRDFHFKSERRAFYFLAAVELFYPVGDAAVERFINNTRIYGGPSYKINARFNIELHYIFQSSSKFNEDGLQTTENILRLRLFLALQKPE